MLSDFNQLTLQLIIIMKIYILKNLNQAMNLLNLYSNTIKNKLLKIKIHIDTWNNIKNQTKNSLIKKLENYKLKKESQQMIEIDNLKFNHNYYLICFIYNIKYFTQFIIL